MDILKRLLSDPGFQEIIEWTFLYDAESVEDELPYNISLFEKIGGVSYASWKSEDTTVQKLTDIVIGKIDTWRSILIEARHAFSMGENTWIEVEGLESMLVILDMAKLAVPIELEKASATPILEAKECEARIEEIEHLQTSVYGGKISENLEETEMTLAYIRALYHSSSDRLTHEEQAEFGGIFQEICEKLAPIHHRDFPDISYKEAKNTPRSHPFTSQVLEQFGGHLISRKTYIGVFQAYIDLLGLRQKVRENAGLSSIYDGEHYLEIPTREEYETIKTDRMLYLMAHEIGVHYINQEISEQNHIVIRGRGNVEKEEGLAKIMEGVVLGLSLEDLRDDTASYPYLLAGELLSRERRDIFIRLIVKCKGIMTAYPVSSRELRFFRGFPLESNHTQRKDCTYVRGKGRIISAVLDGKASLKDFFRGKVGIDDILSHRIDSRVPVEKIILPFLLPDVILFMLGENTLHPDQESFRSHILSKYKDLFPEADLMAMSDLSRITGDIWDITRRCVKEIRSEGS